MVSYAALIREKEEELNDLGQDPENLTYVLKELKGWSNLDFLLQLREDVSLADLELIEEIFKALSDYRPPQYLTGKAYFRDLTLEVNEAVLIPRPETEELVSLILGENPSSDLRLLDMGTGSGAIALSLKAECPQWQVTASDISRSALEVARANAKQLNLEVTFLQSDLFDQIRGTFDIIVSNPPYIAWEDKEEVADNVWHWEPHLALFSDENGLAHYRRMIADLAPFLKRDGKLYLEIGYQQGQALSQMLGQAFPQKRIRVLKDSFGKDRMVVMDNG